MKATVINANRPALGGKLGNPKNPLRPDNNSVNAQCASILKWFFNVSPRLSTLDAREKLGIMSPAPRIDLQNWRAKSANSFSFYS